MEIMHCSVSLWLLKRTFDIYMVVPLSLCGVHCCPIPLMEVLVPIIPYVPSDNLLESTCKLFRFKMLSLLLGKVPMLMLYFTSYPFFLKKWYHLMLFSYFCCVATLCQSLLVHLRFASWPSFASLLPCRGWLPTSSAVAWWVWWMRWPVSVVRDDSCQDWASVEWLKIPSCSDQHVI